MKKFSILSLGIIATMGFAMQSCSEDFVDPTAQQNEKYVQDFIQQFGKPDPNHTYSMAKATSVTVTTDHPTNVYVTANIDGTNYCFAQYPELDGTATLQFDIPKDINYINVATDNGITIVPVGGKVNLDKKTMSRAEIESEFNLKNQFTNSNIDFTTFATDMDHSGPITTTIMDGWADDGVTYISRGFADAMSGAEYKQYLNINMASETAAKDCKYIWNGTGEYIYYYNIKRMVVDGVVKDMEVGRIYGNNPSLASSTKFTLVPMVQSDINGEGTNGSYSNNYIYSTSTSELNRWTHTVILDYDNKHISIEGIDQNNYGWFKYIFDDDGFKAKLDGAAAHPLPIAEEWYFETPVGEDRHDLPFYPTNESDDLNKRKYYEAWDAFVQEWLNDHSDVKPYYADEFVPAKAIMATESVGTDPGALPNVTKEGNTYKIKFYTSRKLSSLSRIETNDYNIPTDVKDSSVFEFFCTKNICLTNEKDNNPRTGSEYAIYMRPVGDTNPAHIVTSLDGRMKSLHRHMPGTTADHTRSTNEPELLFMDYDGDGDYSDFIFRVGGSVGGNGVSYLWMLACEDLGTVGDYDFNDLIVGFNTMSYGQTAQYISIQPMAAGGIYPLYLLWNDFTTGETYVVGREIHKWLGKRDLEPFNTTDTYTDVKGTLVKFEYNITGGNKFSFGTDQNLGGGAMQGFWVLVDKQNVLAEKEEELVEGGFKIDLNQVDQAKLNQIIEENGLYKVTNDGSKVAPVAKMILVGKQWEWPKETVDIRTAYPKFKDWVNNQSVTWYPVTDNEHTVKR